MAWIRERSSTAVALLTVLGLLISGCTSGGHAPHAIVGPTATGPPPVPANLPRVTFATPASQLPFPVRDVTAQARQASSTLVAMAGTIRSWNLDCGVRDPLVWQIGFVDGAVQGGNLIGARAMLDVWKWNAQRAAERGVLPPANGEEYQALVSKVENQLPDRGRVTPFTQPGAPGLLQNNGQDCPGLVTSGGPAAGTQPELYFVLDTLRTTLVAGLNLIPGVGGAVGVMVDWLWRTIQQAAGGKNTWDLLLEQVEKLMDQKLAAAKVQELRDILGDESGGLQFLLERYVFLVQVACPDNPRCEGLDPNSEQARDIKGAWVAAQSAMDADRLKFRSDSEPTSYLTLPEFAVFTNLDLTNMRDGIINGKNWGLGDYIDFYKGKLRGSTGIIQKAADYWPPKLSLGRAAKAKTFKCTEMVIPIPGSLPGRRCTHVSVDRFNWTNSYDQLMTLAVSDQAFNWPYFDPDKWKPDDSVAVPPNTRVIYSPVFGMGAQSFDSDGVTKNEYQINPQNAFGTPRDPINRLDILVNCASGGKNVDCPGGSVATGRVGAGMWVAAWELSFGKSSQPAGSLRFGTGAARYGGLFMDFSEPVTGGSAITRAYGYTGSTKSDPVISLLGLNRVNKTVVATGDNTKKENFAEGFPGEILAGVYSAGDYTASSVWKGSPSSIVLVFRYADSWGP